MMTTFKAIRDTVPEYLPLTPAQQNEFGNTSGYPVDKWHLLGMRAVLCLPCTPVCNAWIAWAEQNKALPPGAGTMQMNSNVYTQRFTDVRTPFPHTADDQDIAIHTTGKPLVNWQFLVGVMED